jgi:hypothetical protein
MTQVIENIGGDTMVSLFNINDIIEYVDKTNYNTYYGKIYSVRFYDDAITEYYVRSFKGVGESITIAVKEDCIVGILRR